jgi:hypothetical protein
MRRSLQAAAFLSMAIALGCGGMSGGRQEVTGTISYDGQPVEEGQIIFEPESDGSRLATGQIKAGKYQIAAEHGPIAGTYRVRIEAYRKKRDPRIPPHPYLGEGAEQGVVAEQYLPVEYNARTTLQVEIKDGEENIHNFDLPAKSK